MTITFKTIMATILLTSSLGFAGEVVQTSGSHTDAGLSVMGCNDIQMCRDKNASTVGLFADTNPSSATTKEKSKTDK